MKKYSLMTLDLGDPKDAGRISDPESTWNYTITIPQMESKRDVFIILDQLEKCYGKPIDSVGTYQRFHDQKNGCDRMFCIVSDSTKSVFSYSEKERQKLTNR
jgi:hypothetical protein